MYVLPQFMALTSSDRPPYFKKDLYITSPLFPSSSAHYKQLVKIEHRKTYKKVIFSCVN